MPEHTSFFHYLLQYVIDHHTLEENMHRFGHTLFGKPVGAHSAEPLVAAFFVVLVIVGLAFVARARLTNYDQSVLPDHRLSLRTFFEVFMSYFYGMMKDIMGPERAKRYFPLIGTCALFIFFSNILGLIPGFQPPTSNLCITAGCALVVFLAFNYYGIKENGLAYFKHLAGPVWWLSPLIFPLEVFAMCIRPVTLSIRLMVNMAVDHLLLTVIMTLVSVLVPIPILILGTLVSIIQVLVFCILSSIYIGLATEHETH